MFVLKLLLLDIYALKINLVYLPDQSNQKGISVNLAKKQKITLVIVAMFLGILFYRDKASTDFFNYLKYKFERVKISELQQHPSYGTLIITTNDKIWANQNSDLTRNVEVTFWYEKASLINGVRTLRVIDIPFKSSHEKIFSIPIPELSGYRLTDINIEELTLSFQYNFGRRYPFNHPNTIGTFYYYYTQKYASEEEKKQNCWSGYKCLTDRLNTELTVQINLEGSKKISHLDTFEIYDRSSIKGAAAY